MNKTCCTCQESKPLFMYNKHANRLDGHQNVCRRCTTRSSREYYRAHGKKMRKQIRVAANKRKRRFKKRVREYLQQHPCVDCGFDTVAALDFDHVRGTKKDRIPVLVNAAYSWAVIQDEISKCEVRCANCHRIRHSLIGS